MKKQPGVRMITTRLMVTGLLAVATFVSVAQKTLAAEPPTDPAHAAHVAAAASKAGGQTVDAQLAELRARMQQLEAVIQQQPGQSPPAGTRTMPGMESGAKPRQGGMAGMSGMGTGNPPSGGAPGAMKPTGNMGGMGGAASRPGGEMGMMGMMGKMMGMMDKMMGGGAMPAGAPMGGAAASGGMGDDKMGMDKMEMGSMGGGSAGGGGMGMMDMDTMERAGMMGMMGGMGGKDGSSMAMPSALPGFPGASHLYHIGATGFFLDHPQHIALSTEQQKMLNQIKEQAALDKASADRSVQEAEQALWTLTAADQPDNAQIEAKVAEIEKLRGDARLRFIRAIGSAAQILNDEQRKILTGFAPPAPAAPMPAGGMKDM
ncbi:MAG: Spy/CpxP family protein refolding chaperone [Candidatus Tectimicrobiota bacterium]